LGHLVGGGDVPAAELLRTAAFSGMVHAVALIALATIAERRNRPGPLLTLTAWCFVAGIFCSASASLRWR
jgi:uncharacterized membrane protein YgdD (TMEM256/DUF423 family)